MTHKPFYGPCEPYLQQGDIFGLPIVAPEADHRQRIFRARDGRHGSVVFKDNCEATVFAPDDLEGLLAKVDRTPLHTDPFASTEDGYEEMVVVFARLFRYFVLVSQTCDVSGVDHDPKPFACILPSTTLAEMCRRECLPFKGEDQPTTIHDYVAKHLGTDESCLSDDPYEYPPALRAIVKARGREGLSRTHKENLGKIRKFLNEYDRPGFLFPLPPDSGSGVPESCVDFCAVYTVPTQKLVRVKDLRVATIADPYRHDFGQKFGAFYARVATPEPMRPDETS